MENSHKSTRELLLTIALEIHRSPTDVEPIIRNLEEKGYYSAHSLKSIAKEEWNKLQVPRRLQLEIAERLSFISSAPIMLKPKSSELKETLIDLSEEVEVVSDYLSCLDLILLIARNAFDPTKQKVKLTNPIFHKRAGKYQNALKYFAKIGFKIEGEEMRFEGTPESKQRLEDTKKIIEDIKKGIDEEMAEVKEEPVKVEKKAKEEITKEDKRHGVEQEINLLNSMYPPQVSSFNPESRSPIYSKTYIRIVISSKAIIQAAFNLTEYIDNVYRFVNSVFSF